MNPYIICFHSIRSEQEAFTYLLDKDFWDLMESSEIRDGEIQVKIDVKRIAGKSFEMLIFFQGEVELLCDRCLEPLQIPVHGEERLIVKMGSEFCDNGDEYITISEQEGTADMSQILYEFITLSLPVTRAHALEDCKPEMLSYLVQESPQPGTAEEL